MKSTLQNIAINIGVNWKFIGQVLYSNNSNSRNHFYRVTKIPKRNGKNRTIHAVKGELKILQRKVLEWLSEMYMPSKHAKGFKKKSGIIENAIIHHNKKLILKFDLKDFFPSITFARVRGMFQAYPFDFTEKQSTVLAQISCLDNNGPIPQGGITSPYISNMICRKLDSRLSKFAIKTGMRYSRYADDLTFSTNKWIEIDEIVNSISEIVNTEGFILNNEKTRILNKSKRQAVTGLVVNDGLNVNRRYIRNLRALIYNCKRSGVKSQLTKNNYKDLRNTCSNITISKSGDYYSYRSGLIKKSDNKSIEKIAIEKFMYHIRGMIEFVGQVAKANEPLCEKNYLTRTGIYEQLINCRSSKRRE